MEVWQKNSGVLFKFMDMDSINVYIFIASALATSRGFQGIILLQCT